MDHNNNWILTKIKLGWIFLSAGLILGAAGIILSRNYSNLPYNFRTITGLGIFLIAIGIYNLVHYRMALKDTQVARRLTMEERDERIVFLRTRAGNRAFWMSTLLIYAGLMWVSFAANGGLPPLQGDILWNFLAAAVLIPFGVYIGSILIDQRNN
jgi:hypothetical protein